MPRLSKTSVLTLLVAMGTALGLAGPASAVSASAEAGATSVIAISDAQESAMRDWMGIAGVEPAVQDSLIENFRAGILPLSSTDAAPTSEWVSVASGEQRITYVYADGSRRITTIDKPSPPEDGIMRPAAGSLSGCALSGTGWYVNCKVQTTDAVSSASFVIDWWPSAIAAKLRDMRSKTCSNLIGGCSVSGSILRATQSSAGPAWAELSYRANAGPYNVSGSIGIRADNFIVTAY